MQMVWLERTKKTQKKQKFLASSNKSSQPEVFQDLVKSQLSGQEGKEKSLLQLLPQ